MEAIDAVVAGDARHYHGVITGRRATELGLSRAQVRRRLRAGLWLEVFPGVFFVGGTSLTWEARLAAAVAWAGPESAAAARSAAALYGLDGCRKGPAEVVTCRRISRPPMRCHTTSYLPPHHLKVRDCIRTTSPSRTLFDLGAVAPTPVLARAATDALRKKLTSLGELRAMLEEMARCGRNGTRPLRRFLAGYDPRLSLTANQFEARLFSIIGKAGLPLPEPQEPVLDSTGRIRRVDFMYFAQRVIIEADSFGYHADPASLDRDSDRRNRLSLDGWFVLTFTWRQVMFTPDDVASQIQDALARRT